MKTISLKLLFIISLFVNGVFGDKDETERVSVNDGGSVTLHTHLTDLKREDVIVWSFKGSRIARINREVNENPVYDPDERFTDRLKMNPQTGDLTITNITSQHTGEYQLHISISGTSKPKTFSVRSKVPQECSLDDTFGVNTWSHQLQLSLVHNQEEAEYIGFDKRRLKRGGRQQRG